MRKLFHILPLLVALALLTAACDKAPSGVIGESKMADLLVDLQLAESYIDTHPIDYPDDSTKQVLRQSIFAKHGVTTLDYDTSLVWYAHNMEAYTKVYQQVINELESRRTKLEKATGKTGGIGEVQDIANGPVQPFDRGRRAHPGVAQGPSRTYGTTGDTIDIWQGNRTYTLAQGMKSGFITFDFPPDDQYRAGDRYQLAYKLSRCSSNFKVSLSIDYTDGATTQVTRPTNSDGWVTIDLQSDTARRVQRIYGYLIYNIKPDHVAAVDSLTLLRTRLNPANYAFIKAQRLYERKR